MKILLIYCDDSSIARFGEKRKEFPPIGLLYLAASCEANNIEVELVNIYSQDITKLEHHHIIGLSINSSYNYTSFYNHIQMLREKCDILVVGGQHATIFPQQTLTELLADYLIIGEGEYALPQLIHKIYNNDAVFVSNIITKDNISNVYSENYRIDDLDVLPIPARHLMKKEDILLDKRIYGEDIKSISLITSRGCPHNCEFCANVYKGFRHRSAENVELEIAQLILDYPEMKGLVFLDENLLFSEEHMTQICDRISKYKLKWTCNARVDCFNYTLINKMRDSGCVEVKYGLESGSQRILDRMNKKITLSQISEALIGTHKVGIRTKCFLLFGFPGDNLESAKETIDFLSLHEKYISRINLFNFSPLPNSPIFKKLGNVMDNRNLNNFRLYNQQVHWWGTQSDYEEMLTAYEILTKFINERYGENGKGSCN